MSAHMSAPLAKQSITQSIIEKPEKAHRHIYLQRLERNLHFSPLAVAVRQQWHEFMTSDRKLRGAISNCTVPAFTVDACEAQYPCGSFATWVESAARPANSAIRRKRNWITLYPAA